MILTKSNARAVGSSLLLDFTNPTQTERVFTREVDGEQKEFRILLPVNLNLEDMATSTAIVHSIGARCTLDLKVGDEVAIDYRISSDHDWEGDNLVFANRILFHGEHQQLWKAEQDFILGVRRGNRWHGVGRWVMMQDVIINRKTGSDLLAAPEMLNNFVVPGMAVLSGGQLWDQAQHFPIEVPPGSVIWFPEKQRSYYEFQDGARYVIMANTQLIAFTPPPSHG